MRALESRRRRAFAISAATAFALCALLLVPAQPAYADIAGDVNDWLCGLLRDCCNWMFKAQTGVLGSIGANGILSADFAHMLTSSSDLTMNDVARGVWQVAILPIGCGVLGLVFTLKLIEISQRMDGSQSLPGVKEVVFLLVFFAVFLSAEKLWYGRALAETRIFKHLYVLLLIVVSFVLFDAASVQDALRTIAALFGLGGLPLTDPLSRYYLDSYSGVFLLAAVGATPLPAAIVRQLSESKLGGKLLSVLEPAALLALLAAVTAYLVDGSFNPFLYFRF